MDEIGFKIWLSKNNVNKKMQSDFISRLKRIERELNHCDIDEQYRSDRCKYLMCLFSNMGNNKEMKKLGDIDFPIGKYYMNTFRYALKQYISFLDTVLSKFS